MSREPSPELRERIENTIRFLAVDAVEKAGCGHPGAPMGLARPAFELWDQHLRFDPSDPKWPLRDRFVLSNGHASMLLYSLLHLFGYALSLDEIVRFRQLGSKTPGHPEYGETPGVELTTGPLGQGFAHGVGMALAGRLARARFGVGGEGPGHHLVYGIVSDGDLMEGISAEAGSLAGHLRPRQSDLSLGRQSHQHRRAHFAVLRRGRGRSASRRSAGTCRRSTARTYAGLRRALAAAREETERPSLVITRTVIGRGSPNRAGKSKAHGEALGADEVRLTKQAAGWPLAPEFLIPDDVRAYFAERIREKHAARLEADAQLAAWRKTHPAQAAAWDAARERRLPADLASSLCRRPRRQERRDSQARRRGARAARGRGALLCGWLGRSRRLGGPAVLKGRGTVGPGAAAGEDPFRRRQSPLRRARARDGRDHERHRPRRRRCGRTAGRS